MGFLTYDGPIRSLFAIKVIDEALSTPTTFQRLFVDAGFKRRHHTQITEKLTDEALLTAMISDNEKYTIKNMANIYRQEHIKECENERRRGLEEKERT